MYNISHKNKIQDTLVIEWDIYNFCNQNCFYCEKQENNNNHWNKPSDLNNQLKIIDIFNNYNNIWPLRIHLLGGEPSIYNNIYTLLNKFNNNIYLKLYTNNRKILDLEKISTNIDLHLMMSFHPSEINVEKFIKNIEYYKSNNFLNFEVVVIYSDISHHDICKELCDYLRINNIVFDIYSIFDYKGEYHFKQNNETISSILLDNIVYFDKNINYLNLYNNESKYGYICNKNLYFLDIYGELTSHLLCSGVNILNDVDFLNNLILKDNYCPNTNCYTPPDSYYPKNKATIKDKIREQYAK